MEPEFNTFAKEPFLASQTAVLVGNRQYTIPLKVVVDMDSSKTFDINKREGLGCPETESWILSDIKQLCHSDG